MNRRNVIIGIVVLLLIGLSIYFGVSKYRTLVSSNEALAKDLQASRTNYDSLVLENEKIKKEKDDVGSQLAQVNTDLENTKSDLGTKTQQLANAKNLLKEEQDKTKEIIPTDANNEEIAIELKKAVTEKGDLGKANELLVTERDKAVKERDEALAKNKELQALLDEAIKAKDAFKAQFEAKDKTLNLGEKIVAKSSDREAELGKELILTKKELELVKIEKRFLEADSLVALAPLEMVDKEFLDKLKLNQVKDVTPVTDETLLLITNLRKIKDAAAEYMVSASNMSNHDERFAVAKGVMDKIKAVDTTGLPDRHKVSIESLQKRWLLWQKVKE